MLELCWSQYQLMHSSEVHSVLSFVALSYYVVNAFGFDGFHRQKTEAPVELTTYMFTNFLIDYIQNYLQYVHTDFTYVACCVSLLLT